MRALVTGGGGFLGSYIVEKLLEQNIPVRIFARQNYPEIQKMGVEVMRGDIRNFEHVKKACQSRDIVFHTAAKVGIFGKREEFYTLASFTRDWRAQAAKKIRKFQQISPVFCPSAETISHSI